MTYEFISLDEMATFFESQARGCYATAARAKTKKAAEVERSAAHAWKLASEIVRDAKLTPAATDFPLSTYLSLHEG